MVTKAGGFGVLGAAVAVKLYPAVLVPVAHNSRPGSAPGESGFAFRTVEIDWERFLVVFTSRDRLAAYTVMMLIPAANNMPAQDR